MSTTIVRTIGQRVDAVLIALDHDEDPRFQVEKLQADLAHGGMLDRDVSWRATDDAPEPA